jgi:hypothetical protein
VSLIHRNSKTSHALFPAEKKKDDDKDGDGDVKMADHDTKKEESDPESVLKEASRIIFGKDREILTDVVESLREREKKLKESRERDSEISKKLAEYESPAKKRKVIEERRETEKKPKWYFLLYSLDPFYLC